MLIELVSDDSEESHKKKEGMPKGSTGIGFTLTSLSLCLSPSFSSNLFSGSPLSFFIHRQIVLKVRPRNTGPLRKTSPPQRTPIHTHTNVSIDRPAQTICRLALLKDGCSIV